MMTVSFIMMGSNLVNLQFFCFYTLVMNRAVKAAAEYAADEYQKNKAGVNLIPTM